MAAPLKPWEARVNYHAAPGTVPGNIGAREASADHLRNDLHSMGSGGGGCPQNAGVGLQPPALPARPTTRTPHGYMNGAYMPVYNPSGPTYSGYNGYGPGYGMYGYNRYGPGYMPGYGASENSLMQLAEENYRSALYPVESIIHTFSSIAMMLESTFHTVHMSFRAVVGVAEHFGEMSKNLREIFSALSIVKTFRWLFRRALYLFGVRKGFMQESAWESAASAEGILKDGDLKPCSRPSLHSFMFFALVFAGPYFLWRLLKKMAALTEETKALNRKWMTGESDHFMARALYDFTPQSREELGFVATQKLRLAPSRLQPAVKGWVLASDGQKCGLVPVNYISVKGKVKGVMRKDSGTSTTGKRVTFAPPNELVTERKIEDVDANMQENEKA